MFWLLMFQKSNLPMIQSSLLPLEEVLVQLSSSSWLSQCTVTSGTALAFPPPPWCHELSHFVYDIIQPWLSLFHTDALSVFPLGLSMCFSLDKSSPKSSMQINKCISNTSHLETEFVSPSVLSSPMEECRHFFKCYLFPSAFELLSLPLRKKVSLSLSSQSVIIVVVVISVVTIIVTIIIIIVVVAIIFVVWWLP